MNQTSETNFRNIEKFMGRTKPFNSRSRSKPKEIARHIIVVHNAQHPWKLAITSDRRYKALEKPPGKVVWVEGPITVKDTQGNPNTNYYLLLEQVKAVLEGTDGVSPKDWCVCLAFNHGASNGKITMHPRGGAGHLYDPKAPDWWSAPSWFAPLYTIGVRRLHLRELPRLERG